MATGTMRGKRCEGCGRLFMKSPKLSHRQFDEQRYCSRVCFDSVPTDDRLWPRLREDGNGCWTWQGGTTAQGYGMLGAGGRKVLVHRFAYELVVGKIAQGLVLDHLCRNRRCCNPAHLKPVTHRENILRGEGFSARNARKTHCPEGHPLTGDNLDAHRLRTKGQRICRTCRLTKQREARRRREAA